MTRPQVGCLYPGERLRAAQCLWAAGGQVAASSVGGVAPDLLGRGGDEGCCAAARRRPPIPEVGVVLWVWRRDRPILGRGCGCSPATAMRLCRLTGADPRSGVRGQRRAVVQPPRRSYPTGSPRPGGAVGEDTRLLPRLVSRSFPWAGPASGSKWGIGIPGTMARRAGDPQA